MASHSYIVAADFHIRAEAIEATVELAANAEPKLSGCYDGALNAQRLTPNAQRATLNVQGSMHRNRFMMSRDNFYSIHEQGRDLLSEIAIRKR